MTYAKPEITFLGEAFQLILFLGKGIPTNFETDRSAEDPAYDLDG